MPKSLVPATALAALVLSLVALLRERTGHAGAGEASARLARLEQELSELRGALAALPPSPETHPPAPDERLADLDARLVRLERAGTREPSAPSAPSSDAARPRPAEPEDPAPDPAERAEFAGLLARLIGPDYDLHGTKEEIERFYELARGTDFLAEHLAALEARVAAHPDDLEARMDLAEGYVAKILTIPGGPEQGVWGSRAEEQWRLVSERDPEHWGAHFALGNNYSFYPDVMGRTGDAIRYLERAREVQERLAPAEAHVQTYLSLARMYLREGDREQARATIESGLRFHPRDGRLLEESARLTD